MNTETKSTVKQIDTTQGGGNGYPRHLRMCLTADTMGELRELYDEAIAAGNDVTVELLHRRNGWHLWERANFGSEHDLCDDYYQNAGNDTVVDIEHDSDPEQEAYNLIVGDAGDIIDGPKSLFREADRVEELAEELNVDVEEGETERFFFDNELCVKYSVRTGQNGYRYDSHQYCTALTIVEQEEEEETEE